MNIAATRSGWIFSPTSDLCMFWGPILMACVAWFFFSNVESFKTVHLMLGILLFNSMHVVSTLGPVYRRAKDGEISKLSFYVAPVIISALAFLVFLYSKTLFFAVIAPITLYHIIRQQYG